MGYWSKIITEDLSYKSEGAWLKNEIQKQFCQFASHKDGAQNESIIMHSYHWRPPDDPIPQGSQLMSRAEALEKWNTLKSMGWERCAGPLEPSSQSRQHSMRAGSSQQAQPFPASLHLITHISRLRRRKKISQKSAEQVPYRGSGPERHGMRVA